MSYHPICLIIVLWTISSNCTLEPDCPSVDQFDDFPTYFPYEGNCSMFWQCGNGEAYLLSCPATLYWNQQELGCVKHPHAHCATFATLLETDPPTTIRTTTSTPSTTTITISTLPTKPPVQNGTLYEILSAVDSKVLSATGEKNGDNIVASVIYDYDDRCSKWEKLWKIDFISSKSVVFRSALGDNIVMDGHRIITPSIYPYTGDGDQQWSINSLGGGYFTISIGSTRSLSYHSGRHGYDGINVQLVYLNSQDTSQWWWFRPCWLRGPDYTKENFSTLAGTLHP